jgi:hypothetical protein
MNSLSRAGLDETNRLKISDAAQLPRLSYWPTARFPGARLRRDSLWRYTIFWTKLTA